MSIELGKIQFGHLDAKHEVFTQQRMGSYLLMNAFQMPPSVNFEELLGGAKFFISGLKGSGKTALLLFLKHKLQEDGGSGEVILFKSKLTESERQRISSVADFSAFTDQSNITYQYEYKQNWLWFIISNVVRLIDEKDVIEGRDYLHDLKRVTGTDSISRSSIFSGIQLTKIKGVIENAIKAGPLRTSMKAEIEAVSKPQQQTAFNEIVNICELALANITLRPGKRVSLFFDELELFMNKIDQRERDIYLIRDLLYAISRINQSIGADSAQICVYASIRSEVMSEVNRVGPEIYRDVDDFGVSINWVGKSTNETHAILGIVESKIRASEMEEGEDQTENIWSTYFPERIFGKTASAYLLDISMFKPRNLVSRLSGVSKYYPDRITITEQILKDTESRFSLDIWREIEEELLTSHNGNQVAAIKTLFTGLPVRFNLSALVEKSKKLYLSYPEAKTLFGSRESISDLLKTMYRIGAVGNRFNVGGSRRDLWVFRDHPDPLMDRDFVFHDSLRKALQLV